MRRPGTRLTVYIPPFLRLKLGLLASGHSRTLADEATVLLLAALEAAVVPVPEEARG